MPLAVATFDALDRIFPDTAIPAGFPTVTTLAGPRGGRISFQVACTSLIGHPKFTLNGLNWPMTIRRILYVPVEANTSWDPIAVPVKDRVEEQRAEPYIDYQPDPRMKPHVVRAAPFEVAEVLTPVDARPIETGRPTVYFVALRIPRRSRPGMISFNLRLKDGTSTIELPINVCVGHAVLPERQTLKVTNWFSLKNIAQYHHLKMWSPAYWAMLKKYARLMRTYGQNVFWVPPDVFVTTSSPGKLAFHWPRFDRYVKLFLAEGFEWIEGGHFAARKVGANPSLGQYVVLDTKIDALSLPGQYLLQRIAAGLWTHLKANQWDRRFFQHVADEPAPTEALAYLRLANLLRKTMPGVKLLDAILGTPAVQNALDVHVPNLADFTLPGVERDPDFDRLWSLENFQDLTRHAAGELWFYSCCGPRGPALNRFLDFPLIRTRLIHWLNFVYDVPGYLHWGLNMYLDGQDPFKQSVNPFGPACHCKLPPGDMHVVWPGPDGPWPSLRLEAMRDGIDDYELLLAKNAKTLAWKIVRSPVDFNGDVRTFRKYYHRLID